MSNCPDHCSECRCIKCGQKWLADRAADRIREEFADEWLLSGSKVQMESTSRPPVGQNLFELYKAACDIPWEPRKLRPRRFTVEPFVIRKTLY